MTGGQLTIYEILAERWWDPAWERHRAELDRQYESAISRACCPGVEVDAAIAQVNAADRERKRARTPGWLPARPGRRMPSVWALVQYWAPRDVFCVFEDAPHCFACRRFRYAADEAGEPKDLWNKALGWLERAHLADRYPYGLDGPQNIVPLCYQCHREMPEFSSEREGSGAAAIEWVRDGYMRRVRAADTMREQDLAC